MRVGDPDGHGRYGYIDHDSDGLLICHDCGKGCAQLATHARYAHGYASAADYRQAHGLRRSEKLAAPAARQRMSQAYERNRDLHLEALEKSRDPERANARSVQVRTTPGQWSPAARVSFAEHLRSRRGRGVTEEERAMLGDDLPMDEWCRRAREILQDPTISVTSMSLSLGWSAATVQQRLRRYPQA